jgi:hypothetical protein
MTNDDDQLEQEQPHPLSKWRKIVDSIAHDYPDGYHIDAFSSGYMQIGPTDDARIDSFAKDAWAGAIAHLDERVRAGEFGEMPDNLDWWESAHGSLNHACLAAMLNPKFNEEFIRRIFELAEKNRRFAIELEKRLKQRKNKESGRLKDWDMLSCRNFVAAVRLDMTVNGTGFEDALDRARRHLRRTDGSNKQETVDVSELKAVYDNTVKQDPSILKEAIKNAEHLAAFENLGPKNKRNARRKK